MELRSADRVLAIRREEYAGAWTDLKHVFLAGDLRRDPPHPFVRDGRLEIILTSYASGDDGEFHWHPEATEYEYVLEGEIGAFEVSTGTMHWNTVGDMLVVPPGVCVRRLVREPARTLALKVPSDARKIHCGECPRPCQWRIDPFGG
jgi:8-oxo-dGTP diphosphatase